MRPIPTRLVSNWLITVPLIAFALSQAISGALIVAIPAIQMTSITLVFLPKWTATVWGFSLLAGGTMICVGALKRRPDFESSGLVVLASAQLFSGVTSYFALGFVASLLGLLLRGGLAIALLGRAYVLVREGKP